MKKSFLNWFISCSVASCILIFAYIGIQQNYRISANDPQIQMAEDGATALAKGADPASLMPLDRSSIDISKSLMPFMVVFDDSFVPLESSGYFRDKVPVPPLGVFDSAKKFGENRFTWQPEKGTRLATVLIRYDGKKSGFILAGRSLLEVEKREDNLTLMFFSILALVIFLISIKYFYVDRVLGELKIKNSEEPRIIVK